MQTFPDRGFPPPSAHTDLCLRNSGPMGHPMPLYFTNALINVELWQGSGWRFQAWKPWKGFLLLPPKSEMAPSPGTAHLLQPATGMEEMGLRAHTDTRGLSGQPTCALVKLAPKYPGLGPFPLPLWEGGGKRGKGEGGGAETREQYTQLTKV